MAIVTRNTVRELLVREVERLRLSFTPYPIVVQYDNKKTVDLTTQQKPFIELAIVYQDGDQVGLGKDVPTRLMGTIVLAVRGRSGTGVVDMDAAVDHFFRPLGKTDKLSPLRTYAARFSSSPEMLGWVAQAILIPFWYDTE